MKQRDYKEYKKKWREKNRNHIQEYRRKYYQNHKEKESYQMKEYKKKYSKKYNEYYRKRKKIDPKFRLDCNIATLISLALKGKKVDRKWQELVDYTIVDLIKHLENLFSDKMDWNNYGSYWWIDHIKPRSLFNFNCPEDKGFQECWALKNLQPLEKIANIKKGNKFGI